jgi:hypothetical protein
MPAIQFGLIVNLIQMKAGVEWPVKFVHFCI